MNLSTPSKYEDMNKSPIVKIIGIRIVPIPHNIPIPDITHIKAAVVTPIILSSCFIITPPPKKPIPVTIFDIILVGSPPP